MLGTTEVNCNFMNSYYFVKEETNQVNFGFNLWYEMTNNIYTQEEEILRKVPKRGEPKKSHQLDKLNL